MGRIDVPPIEQVDQSTWLHGSPEGSRHVALRLGRRQTRSPCCRLAGRDDVDVANRHGAVGDHCCQHPLPHRRKSAHCRLIEQGCGIVQLERDRLALMHTDGQITLDLSNIHLDRLGRHSRAQRDRPDVEITGGVRQRNLHQWCVRRRSLRRKLLHQLLEMNVGIRERFQIPDPHMSQQIGHRGARINLGPQHERVDEHPDQIFQRWIRPPGNRRTDHHIGGGRQSRHRDRRHRMENHERGDLLISRQPRNTSAQFRRHVHAHNARSQVGNSRTRSIHRQISDRRHAPQPLIPVSELTPQRAIGITDIAQHPLLPQRVIGVLHREGCPSRSFAGDPACVGGQKIPQEHRYRLTVERDVMHHDKNLGDRSIRRLPDAYAHRELDSDVEAPLSIGDQIRLLRDDAQIKPSGEISAIHDLLTRTTHSTGVIGTEDLVPIENIDNGLPQRGQVDAASEPERQRNVVRGRVRIELVDEPHPALHR